MANTNDYDSPNSEQDLSAGELVDLEPDELQPIVDPPSRLAGYNQSQHSEADGSDELDNGSDDLPRPEFASGGNQTEAINRQTEFEETIAKAFDDETKTTN